MSPSLTWSLTEHLLSTNQEAYKFATQAPFLLAAAEGRLPKEILSTWLANDRLYIHAYIRAAGQVLASIDLPRSVPRVEAPETQLVDWLIEALSAVRREERFFIDVSARYGLGIELPTITKTGSPAASDLSQTTRLPDESKLPGLVLIERIFESIQRAAPGIEPSATAFSGPDPVLPWLEAAVTFWATERCYLDAWSWSKSKQPMGSDPTTKEDDADGGALRREFIPNWSSSEFAQFVARLGGIVDFAVSQAIDRLGDSAKESILRRVEPKFKSLLAAEAAFWPSVD